MTEKIKLLKPIDLTSFVYTVQELCPKALVESDPKNLQIRMNDIEKEVFTKLLNILDDKTNYGSPNKKFKEE